LPRREREKECGAPPGRADADSQPPGMLGEAAGHEGDGLLLLHAHELDFTLSLSDDFDDRIDSVADYSKDMRSAAFDKRGEQNICRGLVLARESFES
jgi:hypothetical protein